MLRRTATYLFIIYLFIFPWTGYGENDPSPGKFTISGRITDQSNGEALIGATVFVRELSTGTASDLYGNYSISLPEGEYTLVYSYVGYRSSEQKIKLMEDRKLMIELLPNAEVLDEVEISSEKQDKNISDAEMSVFKLDIKTIEKIPSLMGEVDIIKAIQLMPGVQSVSEGGSGFSVRGGAPDQNLIQLDEANVYNASHLMGFFSVFNNDAIRDVTLYKGDIPSQYGGRLSSVLDVRMKEGNNKHYEVTGGIGLIASRLTVEGPIVKDRLSFMVSARRTYADLFLAFSNNQDLKGNKLYFYDLNAKLNYLIGDKDHIYLSGYFGRDVFKNNFARMNWGNGTGTLRWNHGFSNRVFGNFTAIYTDYRYFLGTPEGTTSSFDWNANLRDAGVKGDLSWYLNTSNTLRFGVSAIYHMINPGVAKGAGSETVINTVAIPKNYSLETALYAGNEQKAGRHWTFKYGIRASMFQNIGPGTVFEFDSAGHAIDSVTYPSGDFYKTYIGIEPRIGVLFTIDKKSSVKTSYSRTIQYLQLAQNTTVGTPLDIWFPASPNVKPQTCDQVALGYFRNFRKNTIETSAEGYYKYMNHVIDFRDHAILLMNNKLEGEILEGTGYSYGAEFLVRLNEKKLNGWVSYTYSRSFREIPGINDGNPYPAPYDKPHSLNIVASYQISRRWSVSGNWIYATGNPVTFPTGRAVVGGKVIPIYSDRNAYRYEDYHRLDLSVVFSSKEKPGAKFNWDLNFSVYNVYNRHNTWTINFVQDNENPDMTYAEKVYLFGIIPSVTFNFHF
jgi:hypothetical protein